METYHTSNPWGGSANVSTTPKHTTPHPHHHHHHHHHPISLPSLINPGLLKSTLLPSLTINSTLALAAYAAGRATDRLETKDLIWPVAPVLNAWFAAVLRNTAPFASRGEGVSLSTAWRVLGGADKLLLGGVTLWGARLLYRVANRARKRGRDDPRYEAVKHQRGVGLLGTSLSLGGGGFWDWAWLSMYLPEAVVQSVISLAVTTPFRLGLGGLGGSWALGVGVGGGYWGEVTRAVAVGLFSAGFALELLADWQLGEFKDKAESHGKMCREGVWSVVRHPNYLGDALVHFSYPLFLFANNMLAPIALLGPLANYLFLRYIGGDKQTEESQTRRYGAEDVAKKVDFDKYRHERNSFWPDVSQVHNKWIWTVVGCGVAGALLEKAVRGLF